MHFSRRRKGVTNYRKRLALLKSGLPRAVVRFTNAKVMVQITNFEGKGDRVLACASSSDLDFGFISQVLKERKLKLTDLT